MDDPLPWLGLRRLIICTLLRHWVVEKWFVEKWFVEKYIQLDVCCNSRAFDSVDLSRYLA